MGDVNAAGISYFAGSVGCLVDRALKSEEVLGTVWLVEPDKVATCAHVVVAYGEYLPALKVRFPGSKEEHGVAEAKFHRQFNLKQAFQMARNAIASPVPGLALQEQNLVVLRLLPQPQNLDALMAEHLNIELSLPVPAAEKGLSGSLKELDLALVVQTIANARKQGNLVVLDERNRPLAKLFIRNGKLMHACFGNLIDEAAIYQIVSHEQNGNFYFRSSKEPDFPVSAAIQRPNDMLLIEAHRRLDEIPHLLLELGGITALYSSTAEAPNLKLIPEEARHALEVVWPHLNGNIPIGQLWRFCSLDDYAIFLALAEASKSKQIEEIQLPVSTRLNPLETAPGMPLAPWDEIASLSVDSVSGAPSIKEGHLLGSLRPSDPWHLIHDLELNTEEAGSPLFKNGKVIGMHCGMLPLDTKVQAPVQKLNQLLWVESLSSCLNGHSSGSDSAVIDSAHSIQPGCGELARIDCPRCGRSSLESSRFCKSCGLQLIRDLSSVQTNSRRPFIILSAAVLLVLLLVVGSIRIMDMRASAVKAAVKQGAIATPAAGPGRIPVSKPSPKTTSSNPAAITRTASVQRLNVSVDRAEPREAKWIHQNSTATFHNGDLIRVQIRPTQSSFVYVMYQGTTSKQIQLIFPDSPAADVKASAGAVISIPKETSTAPTSGRVSLQGFSIYGPPGTERMMLIASDKHLALLADQSLVQNLYNKATAVLNRFPPRAAVDAAPAALGDGVLFKDPANGSERLVYLTRLEIPHRD